MIRNPLRVWLAAFGVFVVLMQCAAAGETFKQSEDGLTKEFEAFLKAYHKGDDVGMDQGFGVFRIPNEQAWFAEHFSPEDAARFSRIYGTQVTDAQNSLIEDMNHAGSGNKYSIHCEARGDAPAGKQVTRPVRVEQYVMEFQAYSTREKFLFMANFVYIDGAYRYVGGGGGPFWAKL